jgi:hypothetical protein
MVPLKELIHEEFGDGIMSAIDFSMNISREAVRTIERHGKFDRRGDGVARLLGGFCVSMASFLQTSCGNSAGRRISRRASRQLAEIFVIRRKSLTDAPE